MWRLFTVPLRPAIPGHTAQLERAVDLLDAMLNGSERDVGVLVGEFEKMAADVDSVLCLTSRIVTCVEEDCTGSLGPMTTSLADAARQFVADRLQSASGVADAFTSEAVMLEELSGLTRYQAAIAREVELLGILAHIEAARLGTEGERFQNMVGELHAFSMLVSTEAEDIQHRTRDRQLSLADRRIRVSGSVQRMKQRSLNSGATFRHALAGLDDTLGELTLVPAQFSQCVAEVANSISRVVAAVQLQDVTRQQVEHVRGALAEMSARKIAKRDEAANARHAAILRVQKLQLEFARKSAEGWVEEIETCLEGMLHIGSGEIMGIGAKILGQEQQLAGQLEKIAAFEGDAKADDAVIESCLGGLDELSQAVRAHLDRCETARQQMLLLNLNSIVEACHLGERAGAVMEIAGQISRIAAQWSERTGRSGQAVTEALSALRRAEHSTRSSACATGKNLQQLQQKTRAGLERLKNSAQAVAGTGAQIHSTVQGLQSGIAELSRLAGTLKESLKLIGDACEQIEQIETEREKYDPLASAEGDRAELEKALSATYTSECERQVLRAALYGEAMPSTVPVASGNDVELF
jgi:hypothetical protein